MKKARHLSRSRLVLLVAAQSSVVFAAPTSEEPARAALENPPVVSAPVTSGTANSTGGGQALDLLIQMQPQSAGIPPKEQRVAPLRRVAPTSPTGAASPTSPAAKGSPLFGAPVAPPSSPETKVDSAWTPGVSNRPGVADGGEAKAGGAASSEPSWLRALPREFILFVRDNREWIVGFALGALALFWVGSAAFSRRRA